MIKHYIVFSEESLGCIITNIRPTKSLRLILGLILEINLAEIESATAQD